LNEPRDFIIFIIYYKVFHFSVQVLQCVSNSHQWSSWWTVDTTTVYTSLREFQNLSVSICVLFYSSVCVYCMFIVHFYICHEDNLI